MDLKQALTNLLVDSLEDLICIGSNRDFWGTTRANSDAILAITTCLPNGNFSKLKDQCLDRISKEANDSNEYVNWEEEIWDTSIAIMALSTDYNNNDILISKGLNWIESKYIKIIKSWNEEVWETLLALNAITFSRNKKNKEEENYSYFKGSIEQLNNFLKEGILINWSNTALYILYVINSAKLESNENNKEIINQHIKASCDKILKKDINLAQNVLWTSETWSNGLVLWAISEAKYGVFSEKKLEDIISWFEVQMNLEGTPIEDKAFACIGMYKYLEYLEYLEYKKIIGEEKPKMSIVKSNLQNRLSELVGSRVKDFVPIPPLLDKSYHTDYYTINLNKRFVNILFIVSLTLVLTFFSVIASYDNDNIPKWIAIIPILIGTYATVSQIIDFNIFKSKKNNNEK